MSETLYIVATPIGNLSDISPRAIETLTKVDLIACEDTRVTKKLTDRYEIKTPRTSLFAHSGSIKIDELIAKLKEGKSIAYVSDAGTPGVNDPGGKLVERAYAEGINVSPIPGPSAITTAISVCGFPMERFRYTGFVPHKKGRETFFKTVSDDTDAVLFFESTHRIEKTIVSLQEHLQPSRELFVGRELTKQFETLYRGTIDEVAEQMKNTSLKGEFVIIISPIRK
ncbi:MAG: 16S rRNA (cytidine(1402)-2'-O)-methyltransferase [bacterium]|nr:16S rRNA (cytidine(1402)-2'-O)-methyltransferase [bacterium]